MRRVMITILLQAAVLLVTLPQAARAGDGDVDYSSPYITVDPETGQLVTRNPGPRLKTHSMDMSNETTAGAAMEKPSMAAETTEPGATMAPGSAETDSGFNSSTMAIIAGGLFVFGVVVARMIRQKH